MKKLLMVTILGLSLAAKGQIVVNLQLPPVGVMQKGQLWNMSITNTGTSTIYVSIDLMLTEITNSMQVMTAKTPSIAVPPGTLQLNNTMLQPIQYNILDPSYQLDASPNGLLPVGDFDACFSFLAPVNDGMSKIAEECQELVVDPLSPPRLVFPVEEAVIEMQNPVLTWLPPAPANMFTNLRYSLDLVEVMANQDPQDAMQQNIPLFHQAGIPTTSLIYPTGAQPLEFDKLYAWRVTAMNGEVPVGQSETWTFTIKHFATLDSLKGYELPFVKLSTTDEAGFAVCIGTLKFDYLNEAADSVWNISVRDLSSVDKPSLALPMDSVKLKPGQNLVTRDLSKINDFEDKHMYLLEVHNSRQELWRLRFVYRKPDEK